MCHYRSCARGQMNRIKFTVLVFGAQLFSSIEPENATNFQLRRHPAFLKFSNHFHGFRKSRITPHPTGFTAPMGAPELSSCDDRASSACACRGCEFHFLNIFVVIVIITISSAAFIKARNHYDQHYSAHASPAPPPAPQTLFFPLSLR